MKQIHLHILSAAVATMTLTACGKEYIEPDTGNVAPVFTASIEGGHSRAIDSVWEPDDQIGISTSVTPMTSNVYNVCYETKTANGDFTAKNIEEQIYYKSTSLTAQVTFNAYYPYKYIADLSTATNRSIAVSTSDQKEQKSFDYLFATAKGTKESPAVDLEFTHKMSKVTFVFKNGNGFDVSDIISYRLGNLYMDGKFNIANGSFTTLTNISAVSMDLTDVKNGEPVTPLILIPQTVPNQPVRLEITTNNLQVFVANLSFPSNRLTAGNNYQFTVTVNKTGLIVNSSIEDWITKEDTGWGSGTAGSADDPEE